MAAALCAAALAIAFWPRIEPSTTPAKAAVEQPVYVASPPPPIQRVATISARPIATDTIEKVANPHLVTTEEAAPVASTPVAIDEARRLCAKGLVALAEGNISIARAFLKRAADAGDGRALIVLGDTYDPTTLSRLGVVGLKGDEVAARSYYSRALAAGAGGARERIAALASK